MVYYLQPTGIGIEGLRQEDSIAHDEGEGLRALQGTAGERGGRRWWISVVVSESGKPGRGGRFEDGRSSSVHSLQRRGVGRGGYDFSQPRIVAGVVGD